MHAQAYHRCFCPRHHMQCVLLGVVAQPMCRAVAVSRALSLSAAAHLPPSMREWCVLQTLGHCLLTFVCGIAVLCAILHAQGALASVALTRPARVPAQRALLVLRGWPCEILLQLRPMASAASRVRAQVC